MDKPLTCKNCSKESYIIYKELSLKGQTQVGLCKDCSMDLKAKETKTTIDQQLKQLTCSTCHSSITSISEGQALGCCGCYDTFQSYITQLLLNNVSVPEKLRHFLQQDAKFQLHIGRTPFNNSTPDMTQQIEELEQSLEHALKTENYELAASYRDQLAQLKLLQNKPSL